MGLGGFLIDSQNQMTALLEFKLIKSLLLLLQTEWDHTKSSFLFVISVTELGTVNSNAIN